MPALAHELSTQDNEEDVFYTMDYRLTDIGYLTVMSLFENPQFCAALMGGLYERACLEQYHTIHGWQA